MDIQTAWLMGDVNFDGNVDSQDFALMSANAPASQAAPMGLLALTPVPEPATLLLTLPAAFLLLRQRHGGRKRRGFRRNPT